MAWKTFLASPAHTQPAILRICQKAPETMLTSCCVNIHFHVADDESIDALLKFNKLALSTPLTNSSLYNGFVVKCLLCTYERNTIDLISDELNVFYFSIPSLLRVFQVRGWMHRFESCDMYLVVLSYEMLNLYALRRSVNPILTWQRHLHKT